MKKEIQPRYYLEFIMYQQDGGETIQFQTTNFKTIKSLASHCFKFLSYVSYDVFSIMLDTDGESDIEIIETFDSFWSFYEKYYFKKEE